MHVLDAIRREIISKSPKKELKKGQHLLFTKNHHTLFYMVISGCLKSYFLNKESQEIILNFYLPGHFIGLEKIEKSNVDFNVQTLKQAKLAVIDLAQVDKKFMELCLHQTLAHDKIHSLMMASAHIDEKIALFFLALILHMKTIYGELASFPLPMNMVEVSKHLSISRESLSRILSHFKQENILSVKKHTLEFYDEPKLTAIANMKSLPSIAPIMKNMANQQ